MKIVIVGAQGRNTAQDKQLVEELIDLCSREYPGCMFVTMLTFDGVGRFVREKCLEKDANNRYRYQLIECNVTMYASNISKSEASIIYLSRNASVFELGDLFYYFANQERRGTIEELIDKRVIPSGRPYKIFMPGEPVTLVNM